MKLPKAPSAVWLALAIAAMTASNAQADRQRGMAALKAGQHAEALRELEAAATQVDAVSEFLLASMYYDGRGVAADPARAAEWMGRAAGHGDAQAQYIYGQMLQTGSGVARDEAQAFRWYEKAAQQNDDDATVQVGAMLVAGVGTTRDLQAARRWLLVPAQRGNARAQFALGNLLDQLAVGTKAGSAEAAVWYQKAAAQGDTLGEVQTGIAYALGRGVKQDLTAADHWLRRADAKGHAAAGCYLALVDMWRADLGQIPALSESEKQARKTRIGSVECREWGVRVK